MSKLALYDFISRAHWLNYRGKIMLMAFTGTHVPLLALIGYFIATGNGDWVTDLVIIGVALVATLVGTGVTLFVLNELLRPVVATSKALRIYRTERRLPELPTHYRDEAGTLMADAQVTLVDLDRALSDLARFDRVTGLVNREALMVEIAHQLKAGEMPTICAIRLNGYDDLTATFDQATADRVVQAIARRLVAASPEGVVLARVGGGLFASVFAPSDEADLHLRTAAALEQLRDEVVTDVVTVTPDLAAGLAIAPRDGTDPETLLDNAISAIGTLSPGETTPVRFFSPAARDEARARFLTEQDLRRAVANNEFVLHYQPVVNTAVGRTVGAEALIRWQHPERGLISPAEFIPIAEASGLIDPIGRWVLTEAAGQVKRWAEAGRDDLNVAVNISARQFRDPSLMAAIRDAISGNNLRRGSLEIELTETAAMQDRERARSLFAELREMGVAIAIDDFGTGYSSMSNLLDLPFDLLKIDRQFVTGVDRERNAQAICSALIALARGLRTDILAEGVESAAEVDALKAMGVLRFQGFYFSRPLPADDFLRKANDLRGPADAMARRTDADAETRRTA